MEQSVQNMLRIKYLSGKSNMDINRNIFVSFTYMYIPALKRTMQMLFYAVNIDSV